MNKLRRRFARLAVAACLVPVLLSGCARTVSTTMDDATISTRVKTALLNEPDVALARIEVDTVKGVVTLSGRVRTKDEEARAIAAARKIQGVTDVKSTLEISQSPIPYP